MSAGSRNRKRGMGIAVLATVVALAGASPAHAGRRMTTVKDLRASMVIYGVNGIAAIEPGREK